MHITKITKPITKTSLLQDIQKHLSHPEAISNSKVWMNNVDAMDVVRFLPPKKYWGGEEKQAWIEFGIPFVFDMDQEEPEIK